MLFGHVSKLNLVPYIHPTLRALIQESWMIAHDDAAEDGQYALSMSGAYVVLARAKTSPKDQRSAKFHKHYLDIELLLEGREAIGFSNHLEDELVEMESLEHDIKICKAIKDEQFVTLAPGDFALFYPNQPHRPLCTAEEAGMVRKAIIKIPCSLVA
ncbi:YhcH/YjgK/YiaL family protein [Vibrio sp. WXL103]|uniref:YhcH/YjgK/YiaL family protein n=1 Tax=Vibrio sp. WXL103 TaxID=3450710 RepID=UPI003EC58177